MSALKTLGFTLLAGLSANAVAAEFSFDHTGSGVGTGITPVGKLAWEQSLRHKKDAATRQVLKLLEYKNIEAYFVKVRSRALKGKLYEIVCRDYGIYDMILHSTDTAILNSLREEGVFSEESRVSLIDGYVNARY